MLVGNTYLLSVQVVHIANGIVVDIIGNRQFDWTALMVHQVVHQIDALPVRVQLVLHAHFSHPLNTAVSHRN